MFQSIIQGFQRLVPCGWTPTEAQVSELQALCAFACDRNLSISKNHNVTFIEAVNQKLALNQKAFQHILDVAFQNGIKLNYLLKNEIRTLLDSNDVDGYQDFLIAHGISSDALLAAFQPVTENETRQALIDIINSDKLYNGVLNSIFSRFAFNLFDRQCVSEFFSGVHEYEADYFSFVSKIYPDMCKRDNALAFVDVDKKLFSSYEDGCNTVLQCIKTAFESLNNHCDLAVFIPEILIGGRSIQWELFSDIVLFAEKMLPETIDKAYFRWKKIEEATLKYIPELKNTECHFDTAFQGFVFKDCFVIKNTDGLSYSLLLIFEKNRRDERPLYCPACRSLQIEGNSYPILNVRSWECENPLCPDRSKYNRGKRYAFSSVLRQKLMSDDANRIPEESIAYWHLDCVEYQDKSSVFEMVLRHYSCTHDGIQVFTCSKSDFLNRDYLERNVHISSFATSDDNILSSFRNCDYFRRYIQFDFRTGKQDENWKFSKATVYHADSFELLKTLPDESIDGAVTSPPYYNAKEYSQWENIYCYLYDMYNISAEIYRTLKQGSVFLYNIFDYFDNEKNIVFSAMGNKRMILGAYMLDIFRRIGFTIQGNIIWYKGEIQGNRSFNQGNLSPYYQAPLNCWEHVFVISKGVPNEKFSKLISCVKSIRPVIKMVHGKNILGHTAPYPIEIPELLADCMKDSDVILDPFLGSGTTVIAAEKHGIYSIGIEKDKDYFELCKKIIRDRSVVQLSFNI